MTALKVEILNYLDKVPDNQLSKVLDYIKNILVKDDDDEDLKKSQAAYESLKKISQSFKGINAATYDELLEMLNLKENPDEKYPDYRDEVAREVLKKYASID